MKVVCKECKVEFETDNIKRQFCSISCSATHNNRGVSRNKKNARMCSCGNKCSNRHNKYCDQCIKNRIYTTSSLCEAKTDKTRRAAIIRLSGHVCSVCKNSEWNGKKIPLEVDHINGDASNNSCENLRVICPNCHAQTTTYKGKNKGKSKRNFFVVSRIKNVAV
jgi:hypothetical protein